MSHSALILEPDDTIYIGILKEDGEYIEIRVAHTKNKMLVTTPEGNFTL